MGWLHGGSGLNRASGGVFKLRVVQVLESDLLHSELLVLLRIRFSIFLHWDSPYAVNWRVTSRGLIVELRLQDCQAGKD